jgi:hypothetical protein
MCIAKQCLGIDRLIEHARVKAAWSPYNYLLDWCASPAEMGLFMYNNVQTRVRRVPRRHVIDLDRKAFYNRADRISNFINSKRERIKLVLAIYIYTREIVRRPEFTTYFCLLTAARTFLAVGVKTTALCINVLFQIDLRRLTSRCFRCRPEADFSPPINRRPAIRRAILVPVAVAAPSDGVGRRRRGRRHREDPDAATKNSSSEGSADRGSSRKCGRVQPRGAVAGKRDFGSVVEGGGDVGGTSLIAADKVTVYRDGCAL